jgi:hypothetical protein
MDVRITSIIYKTIIAALCLLITIKIHFEDSHNKAAWNAAYNSHLVDDNRVLRSRLSYLEDDNRYLESRISDLETEVYY